MVEEIAEIAVDIIPLIDIDPRTSWKKVLVITVIVIIVIAILVYSLSKIF